MCLAGTVVASWSLTQEVTEWQIRALLLEGQILLSLNSANSVKPIRENSIATVGIENVSTDNNVLFYSFIGAREKNYYQLLM